MFHFTRSIAAFAAAIPLAATADTLYQQDFESGALGPGTSIVTVGVSPAAAGIKPLANFGSTQAFGFGRSGCAVNCFDAFTTGLTIAFDAPTFVSTISFKEMELFGNWGSGGAIFLDGVLFGTTHFDYGRLPYNDLVADTSFRSQSFTLDRTVTTIELRVRDITNQSEIYIDDIVVSGVPEPAPAALFVLGAGWLAWRRRHAVRP